MPTDRDDDLVADYLDGGLGPAEAAAFRDRVVGEPALARALYLAAVDEAFLRAQAKGQSRVPAAKQSPRRWRGVQVVGLAALAASLLFAAWALWPSTEPVVVVARVERLTACQWGDGGVPGDTIARGQAFQLRSGVAEFTTPSGVRTVFEGPAAFQFEGADVVRLTSGRLFCDVPKGAEGFTVQTANGRVVDLGTRFGVEIGTTGETEIHVMQGRVRAEVKDSAAQNELTTGQAGRFRSGAATITMVPVQRARFATASGLIYEPFDYPANVPLVGQGGWFDRDATQPLPTLGARDVRPYPPLPEPQGSGLSMNARNGGASRPVGRMWPTSFTSALLWLDDDLIKGMRMTKVGSIGIIGFGQPDSAKAAIRLVVKPGIKDANFGLQIGEQTLWCSTPCKHHETHFVVLQTGGPAARLWVNPSPVSFGAEASPPADVEISVPTPTKVETLWIGQPGTPGFAWWQIDEIRGGFRWSDVTPRAVSR